MTNLGFHNPNQEVHSLTGDSFSENAWTQAFTNKYQRELYVIINHVLHQQFSVGSVSHM